MAHITANKPKLLARVSRINGQVSALERAIADDVDCIAILQQAAAVRGALGGLMEARPASQARRSRPDETGRP